jgi:DNA polymerase-3 subunit gamma/tau
VNDIADHLAKIAQKEAIQYEPDALQLIATKADGGLRDALSIFDQIVNFSGRNVTYPAVLDNLNVLDHEYYFRVGDCINNADSAGVLVLFSEILEKGFEPYNFLSGLSEHFRNLLVGRDKATFDLLELAEGVRKRYIQQSKNIKSSVLLNAFNLCQEAEQKYRGATNPRLLIELLLLKLVHLPSALEVVLNEAPGVKKKAE